VVAEAWLSAAEERAEGPGADSEEGLKVDQATEGLLTAERAWAAMAASP
jgi:hypothetical protein